MNKVILIGRLGKDPELRHTQNADPVCNFTLATVERWRGRDGQKQEKTEWHKITVWGPQAESVAQYLRKGDRAGVIGQIETRRWTDRDGNQRETMEIRADSVEFLHDRRPEEGRREKEPAVPAQDWSGADDDIPF